MATDFDVIVVGCGVVGASVAHALAKTGREVTIVEKSHWPGSETTSRNSGVVHAGLYYPPDSLKARLCREGRDLIYAFTAEHQVPCEKTGKYLVAQNPQEDRYLDWLLKNAAPTPLHRVETVPAGIHARTALFSPESGVVDQHALVEALLNASQATCLFDQEVTDLLAEGDQLWVVTGADRVCARTVVNCAGLWATDFVSGRRHHYAKGSYFSVKHPALETLTALIYPAIPKNSPSLGIHLLHNLAGEWYLGPDFQWVDELEYGVDEQRAELFARAAARFLPGLKASDLSPGYAGIRPKLSRTENSDFLFVVEHDQLIHCLGIDSPGLTAAMAIGRHITQMLA